MTWSEAQARTRRRRRSGAAGGAAARRKRYPLPALSASGLNIVAEPQQQGNADPGRPSINNAAMRRLAGRLLRLSVGACATLAACTSINTTQRPPALSTDARLQVAAAADASGDGELAIAMYAAAAASNPSNVALQLRCADALARYGKVAEAHRSLTEQAAANSGQPDLIRALALIDLVSGHPDRAIAGFDQVLAANPGDSRALVDKAVALDLLEQHTAAQTIYSQVLATTPDDVAARNNLAVSMMLEGKTRQALETLAPIQDADASPRLKVNLGILYAATGDGRRSRQMLGDSVSPGDLTALTQALAKSGAQGANP